MTNRRFGRAQKAVTLVPLALLSAAWTASLAGVGAGTVATASGETGRLPDGSRIPTEAVEDPANYSDPANLGLGINGNTERIVSTASTNGIPSAALAAYQRSQTVINAADKDCNVPWQLVAAIGRVESDHGRYGGNTLGEDGVSRPGIFGIALDGTNDTQAIADSDGGLYDSDAKWDRAVGPMQFIPTTWAVVGVDADGDSKRNPQDIDDAALATAVYLCSGGDDLATDKGRRASVFRYNHSEAYVDLVLRIMQAYMDGDFTSVPNNTTSAVTFTPDYATTRPTLVKKPGGGGKGGSGGSGGGGNGGGGGTTTAPPTTTDPTEPVPTDSPDPIDPPDLPDPNDVPVVKDVLSLSERVALCKPAVQNALGALAADTLVNSLTSTCASRLEGKTESEAKGALPGIIAAII